LCHHWIAEKTRLRYSGRSGTLPLKVVITLLENVATTSLNVTTDVDGKFVANVVKTLAHNVGKTLGPNVNKTLDV